MKKLLSKVQEKNAIKKLKEGKTTHELAKYYGVSLRIIQNLQKDSGVSDIKKATTKVRKEIKEEVLAETIQQYGKELKSKEKKEIKTVIDIMLNQNKNFVNVQERILSQMINSDIKYDEFLTVNQLAMTAETFARTQEKFLKIAKMLGMDGTENIQPFEKTNVNINNQISVAAIQRQDAFFGED